MTIIDTGHESVFPETARPILETEIICKDISANKSIPSKVKNCK